MEPIITISHFVLLLLILITPPLVLYYLKRKKVTRVALKYFLIGFAILLLLMVVFTIWSEISDLLLLNHYGYSVDGINYENVLPENRERVDELVQSIMGIGWPLKAIFGVVFIIPYLLFVFIVGYLDSKMKKSG